MRLFPRNDSVNGWTNVARAQAKRERKAAKRRRDAELTRLGMEVGRARVARSDAWTTMWHDGYIDPFGAARPWADWVAMLRMMRVGARSDVRFGEVTEVV